MTIRGRIYLKPSRDGPVRGGNPWIFSQAIARVEPADLMAGEWVWVCDAGGSNLGIGYFNRSTTIAVRMLAFGSVLGLDEIIIHRLRTALRFRERVIGADTTCYRLINGEGDGLPGVVVDRYGEVAVLQLLTAGAERMREELVANLTSLLALRAIVERSAGAVRRQEGLPDRTGLLMGQLPCENIVLENGIRLAIDLERGQKTGYFLDQRENRLVAKKLAHQARVFDGYCYAGGFALAALDGGARRVVAADTSARALSWAEHNLRLNGHDTAPCDFVRGEAARYLADSAEIFDLVVLDPPPLARSIEDAARAGHLYAELNQVGMRAVAPGGYLMTFSCSTHFQGDDFLRAVRIAQARAGRSFRLLRRLGAGPDHPVLLGHPEGEYLTGFLLADMA